MLALIRLLAHALAHVAAGRWGGERHAAQWERRRGDERRVSGWRWV